MPERGLRGVFARPFAEQAAFFRNKLNLPSERWDDMLREQHDRAFVVAGAMKADLVADLRDAIGQAIDQGKSIQWFRGEFERTVRRHGWTGWTGEATRRGVAWRTHVIYATNLRTSYQAGRWAQMTDPQVMAARPYWRYVHRSIEHPRLAHKAWHDTVLPAGDPWFNTHYPPNGWGCKCSIETLNERGLQRLGKTGPDRAPDDAVVPYTVPATGETIELPKGVQYGWDYAPGRAAAETALAARQNRLETLDTAVARLNVEALVKSRIFDRFFGGDLAGEFPIAVLLPVDRAALGAESSVVLLSQDSLAAHVARHPEITLADYRKIQTILDKGEVYKQGETRLAYLAIDGVTYRAALKRTLNGRKNYFLTLFRNESGTRSKPGTRIR
ncbi:hypothetical protein D5041_07855 [Verminephrobacter aporrectodeae subsp. tuberculatae]|uniref:phage head morphogenesis protein n=1 Tax=Verminephrobacter aporrectodeae TaxID=1110389 RepID=UPI00223710FA|nr:phage head morphogenesis protein [Verminephrobacter aporrectodeae]MCW5223511.1 hypothetical protein [Verminephrobacter aporrectodeae subsp. tuberculatae]MCW5288976.1 hypothetical protein [Verminephrobacter aporrectodeae subsp. tuberculatae]